MLAQICQFLGVDSNIFPTSEHIIVADRSKDGGFLIHYFLNLCQKQNRPVCFIGLSQSFNHYNTVAQKLGTNLISARDKNFVFIEGLRVTNDAVTNVNNTSNPILQLITGDTSPIIDLIHTSLERVVRSGDKSLPPVVIIDDLSVLLSLGVAVKHVISFFKKLENKIRSLNTQSSLVISINFSEGESDEEDVWTCLSHLSTLSIEVSNLKSGYCKEVHGQIQVQWNDSLISPRRRQLKQTQYKLSDKNINLFASGMSSAVL